MISLYNSWVYLLYYYTYNTDKITVVVINSQQNNQIIRYFSHGISLTITPNVRHVFVKASILEHRSVCIYLHEEVSVNSMLRYSNYRLI